MAEVLLVDDELLALCGMEKGVDWARCGVERVHTALRADRAKAIIRENPIDVMVCDIEMPGGSGIRLYEWVRENCPDVVCIFLSCHAEFSYAQDALALGAFRYLLKPAPYGELEETLRDALAYGRKYKMGRKLFEESRLGDAAGEGDLVQKAVQYIMSHLEEECNREKIAEAVHVNVDYLSRMFKKAMGIGLSEYVLKQRLERARQLLIHTDEPVGLVAEKTGFSYVAYFSKVFKKETGMTPMAFRAEARRGGGKKD